MLRKFENLYQIATCICFLLSGAFALSETTKIDTQKKPDPVVQAPPDGLWPHALLGLAANSPYALLVDKSQRTMTLWKWTEDHPSLVKAFPTDIGRNNGDKTAEGDHRTPEGVYFFMNVKEKEELDFNLYGIRAFATDYPNYFDRLEGKTGTGIWLHAIPDSQSLWRGSRGCVVVRNKVIEELTPYISLRTTPMVVQNNVEYLKPDAWTSERSKIFGWLEKWRAAWETKDLDNYMNYYSEKFHSMGMNKKRWRSYKQFLTEKYSFIKVALSDIQAFKHQGKFMIRFFQKYESDKKQDFGEKVLYVQDADNGMGIVGEEWFAKPEANLAAAVKSESSPAN